MFGRMRHLGDTRADAAAVHGFRLVQRVRDKGDRASGTVMAVSRLEVRWRPDRQPRRHLETVYVSDHTMVEPAP